MYDLIIVGSGISGLATIWPLRKTKQKILLLEAGPPLAQRKSSQWSGFGGLSISEGKYNFAPDFGGDLAQKIGWAKTKVALASVEKLLDQLGGHNALHYQTTAGQFGDPHDSVYLRGCQTKHLGTALAKTIGQNFWLQLQDKVTIKCQSLVTECQPLSNGFKLITSQGADFRGRQVVFATGQQAAPQLAGICQSLGLTRGNSRIDLGFRIETASDALDDLFASQTEIKLRWRELYSYCMNKNGRVISKKQGPYHLPDGQNWREKGPSANLNFTLFKPYYFNTESQATEFLTQRFTALKVPHNQIAALPLKALMPELTVEGLLQPTSDYALVQATNLFADLTRQTCDFFTRLNHYLAKPLAGDSLLYAYDCKIFPPKIKTDRYFTSQIPGLYFIGDCSGETSSLAQAAASGFYLGEHLRNQLK